jgi:ribosomal protein S18 acetylase RimI-like enzyme
LGTTKWRVNLGAPREAVSIVPAFAIDLRFQCEPKGLMWQERYSARIMGDLISRATSLGPRILGLFVDKRNLRAIAFYERCGFRTLPDEGGTYLKMYLDLKPEADS